jgi:hypothetical protein
MYFALYDVQHQMSSMAWLLPLAFSANWQCSGITARVISEDLWHLNKLSPCRSQRLTFQQKESGVRENIRMAAGRPCVYFSRKGREAEVRHFTGRNVR